MSWKALWNYSFGDEDAAIIGFENCLKLDPTNGPNLHTLGKILIKKGRDQEGLLKLEQAVGYYSANNKSLPEAFAYIAYAYFNLNRLDESLEYYQRAIERWVKDGDFKKTDLLYAVGRICLQKGEYVKAQNFFLQGLKLDEKDANIHFGLGISYFEKGEKEESLYHLEKATEIDPSLRNDTTLNKIKKEIESNISIH